MVDGKKPIRENEKETRRCEINQETVMQTKPNRVCQKEDLIDCFRNFFFFFLRGILWNYRGRPCQELWDGCEVSTEDRECSSACEKFVCKGREREK